MNPFVGCTLWGIKVVFFAHVFSHKFRVGINGTPTLRLDHGHE
jgi:hypothetical protein